MKIKDSYYSIHETADILGMKVDRVRYLARKGEIDSEKLTSNGARFFKKTDVHEYKERSTG